MNYFEIALKEAEKAYKINEVPVGCVIVYNNKIIAKAHNLKIKKIDVTSHAEIIAIRRASKKIKDWRLNKCDLYVTLEPCPMCMEVIKQSRIEQVYYLTSRLDYKKEYNKTEFIQDKSVNESMIEAYKEKLSNFFKLKCKR